MNGRISIKLNEKEIQLWFNRYSEAEMKRVFKLDTLVADYIQKNDLPNDAKTLKNIILQDKVLLKEIEKRMSLNDAVLMADFIWIGVVGYRDATLTETQISRKDIRMAIAEASFDDFTNISKVFFDSLGRNLDTAKKKVKEKVKKKN